jgi:hypothetical protein
MLKKAVDSKVDIGLIWITISLAWRGRYLKRNANLNLAISTSGIEDAASVIAGNAAIGACEATDHGVVLVRFVRALAKRQARLDVGLGFDAANDSGPRTLH